MPSSHVFLLGLMLRKEDKYGTVEKLYDNIIFQCVIEVCCKVYLLQYLITEYNNIDILEFIINIYIYRV